MLTFDRDPIWPGVTQRDYSDGFCAHLEWEPGYASPIRLYSVLDTGPKLKNKGTGRRVWLRDG